MTASTPLQEHLNLLLGQQESREVVVEVEFCRDLLM